MKFYTAVIILLLCYLTAFPQTSTPTPAGNNTDAETSSLNPTTAAVTPTPARTVASAPLVKPDDAGAKSEKAASFYVLKNAPARIPRFESGPVIDGRLDDAIWQTAAVFGDFLQIQPGDNIAPTHPTEVLIGYDAKNLYLAFRVKQDRDKIRATVARRDDIFNDDYVGVYLDTFNDQRQAYALFFNPLGVQADGTYSESNGEDYSVDLVMESKGVLTDDGYTIEIAVPFKSLRYEAGKNKQWGIQLFRRVKYNNNELDSWMRIKRGESGTLNKAGHITGLEDISTTRQLEINPSFTVSQSGRRSRFTFDNNPAGRYRNDGLKGDFGLTAKLSLTPTITLDFAYNPDFAQVEADAPVTSANQRFPIFFAEKRPFFLERIDIFQTPMNVVNTRAIVDPDIAAKITGRHGKNTFGLMYASDNAPGNYSKDDREALLLCRSERRDQPGTLCANERFMDRNADIGVFRFKRDVGRENNLGVFATTYNFVDRHNNTGGFDGRIRFTPKTVAEFQLVGTTTRGNFYDSNLDRSLYRTGNGVGYSVWVERSGRNLYMNYLAMGRSRDYRADVGFTQRTDTNYLGSFVQYKTDPDPKGRIVFKRIQNQTNISYDWQRRAQYWITDTQGMLALQRQTFVGVKFQYGYERVFEHEFGATRTATRPGAFFGPRAERSTLFKAVNGFIETTPTKKFYGFFLLDYTWGQMDYDLGAGRRFPRASLAAQTYGQDAPYDPGPGNQLTINSSFRYQPTSAFQTSLDFTKIRLVRRDTRLTAFDDNIYSSRSTYQFTRNTFARLRLDYSTLNRRLLPQLVAGWTPSPGTALYVGYSDDVNYNGWNPYNGRYEPGIHGNGRTFFIKASYLFRKSF
ncbi:MAG: carbohydrate binding family 9 domain-containing protein [Acidobacteria bacterium]|nr:carbohydrate binding family 9 domain-containing protein [Acidobacteriota bacterium]